MAAIDNDPDILQVEAIDAAANDPPQSPKAGPSALDLVITEEEEEHIVYRDDVPVPEIKLSFLFNFPTSFKCALNLHPITIQYDVLSAILWESEADHSTRYTTENEQFRMMLPPVKIRKFAQEFKTNAVKRIMSNMEYRKKNDILLDNIKAGIADSTKIPKYLRVPDFEQSLRIPSDIESNMVQRAGARLKNDQRKLLDKFQQETLGLAMKERLYLQTQLKDYSNSVHIVSKFKKEYMDLQGVRNHGDNVLDSGYKIAETNDSPPSDWIPFSTGLLMVLCEAISQEITAKSSARQLAAAEKDNNARIQAMSARTADISAGNAIANPSQVGASVAAVLKHSVELGMKRGFEEVNKTLSNGTAGVAAQHVTRPPKQNSKASTRTAHTRTLNHGVPPPANLFRPPSTPNSLNGANWMRPPSYGFTQPIQPPFPPPWIPITPPLPYFMPPQPLYNPPTTSPLGPPPPYQSIAPSLLNASLTKENTNGQ
jgi:hypothetical protein